MGEAELGWIDIPTCDEGVKKSFQTLHGNRPRGCIALVVKLFALFGGGWTSVLIQTHFPTNAQSERKKGQVVFEENNRPRIYTENTNQNMPCFPCKSVAIPTIGRQIL